MSNAVLRSKVLVLGPSTVGKTSFIRNFANDDKKPLSQYQMTLSAESHQKIVVNEEKNYSVEFFLYDISGSSIYEYEYPDIFSQANQFIVVFDITRASTLKEIDNWLDKFAKYSKNITGVLVGNKSDLSEYSDISTEDCQNYAKSKGLPYFDVSAKTGANIAEPFIYLSEKFISLYEQEVNEFVHAD